MTLFIALVMAVKATLFAGAPLQAPSSTAASRAGFMAGCWEFTQGDRHVREEWRTVSPDFMISTSVTTVAGVVREFEFQRVTSKDGVVTFFAQPKGVPATAFTLDAASKPDEAIFVNMQHDFPKRVIYQKTAENALTAFIDGGEGTRKIVFPYLKCK